MLKDYILTPKGDLNMILGDEEILFQRINYDDNLPWLTQKPREKDFILNAEGQHGKNYQLDD